METLKNKIDFAGVIIAEKCNPNGDPCNGNRPRQNYDGYGEISDVCLKRKIRDRLFEQSGDIFMRTLDQQDDGIYSAKDQIDNDPELQILLKDKDSKPFRKKACEKWIDVRSFGGVFAFKSEKGEGVSAKVRGPVSIQFAKSIDIVDITDVHFTKNMNITTDAKCPEKLGRDSMGMRYYVEKGVYVFKGSMFPQLAELTGFSDADADRIKQALIHLLDNDATTSRPSGSMCMDKLFWWEHSCPNGQCSSGRVHNSLKVIPAEEYPYYTYIVDEINGMLPEIIDCF